MSTQIKALTKTQTLTRKRMGMTTMTGGAGPVRARLLVLTLLSALFASVLLVMGSAGSATAAGAPGMSSLSSGATADEPEEGDESDYSLYKLSSNAAVYFSNENSPDDDTPANERMGKGAWKDVTESPASAGSLLGYADPEFGFDMKWLTSELSGSSQTIGYDTLVNRADKSDGTMGSYRGMLEYAQFGSTNAALGLDSTVSGANVSGIFNSLTGTLIWALYALAMSVGYLFHVIIEALKLLNPFRWFYAAIAAVSPAMASGMTGGEGAPAQLQGLSNFISQWYGLLVDMSWTVMVPMFLAVSVFSAVMFKHTNRGSLVKKMIVRVLFIGIGLPLIGSMYTQTLNKFDDSTLGSHAGPTKVVLSTYVDFETWMMNDRLKVPEDATIAWDSSRSQPTSDSIMASRNTALAINIQSNSAYDGLQVSTSLGDAGDTWKSNSTMSEDYVSPWASGGADVQSDDDAAVFSVFNMLNRYITSETVKASDFESGVKSTITQLPSDSTVKKEWFVGDKFKDAEEFGEDGEDPTPDQHPIISSISGLDGDTTAYVTKFTSPSTADDCGFQVVGEGDAPKSCNLSPLAAYNYLNSSFSSDSMTAYSSSKATSGFTRETHASVSRVGTGPSGFMYWMNTGTLLASMVLLGWWYGVGMLVTSVKRTVGVVGAIPFATLGAMAGISKVVIYSAALILEVLLTLFLYQFASELLISIPGIIAGPVTAMVNDPNSLMGSSRLGSVVVVVLSFVASFIVIGVTFALLRARSVVLKAVDEAVTKMVNKFLETNVPPPMPSGGNGPGLGSALAGGLGAGAGMAAGSKLGGGSRGGGGNSSTMINGGPTNGGPGSNAGGTNGGIDLNGGPDNNPNPQLGGGNPAALGERDGGGTLVGADSQGAIEAGRDGLGTDGTGTDGVGSQGEGVEGAGRAGYGRDGVDEGGEGHAGYGRDGLSGDQGLAQEGIGSDGQGERGDAHDGVGRDGRGEQGIGRDGQIDQEHTANSDVISSQVVQSDVEGTNAERDGGITASDVVTSDKEAAANLQSQGGLTDYGYGDAGGTNAADGPNVTGTTGGRAVDLNGGTADASGTNAAGITGEAGAAVVAGQSAGSHAAAERHAATERNAVTEPGQARAAGTSTQGSTPTVAGAPRPLSQVPISGRSNHVQRRPGESTAQHLKAKASAEGWRQTPAGWVPTASAPTIGTGATSARTPAAGTGTPRPSARTNQASPQPVSRPTTATPGAGGPRSTPSVAPTGSRTNGPRSSTGTGGRPQARVTTPDRSSTQPTVKPAASKVVQGKASGVAPTSPPVARTNRAATPRQGVRGQVDARRRASAKADEKAKQRRARRKK